MESVDSWGHIYFSTACMINCLPSQLYFLIDPRLREMRFTLNESGRVVSSQTLSERGLLQFRKHLYNYC